MIRPEHADKLLGTIARALGFKDRDEFQEYNGGVLFRLRSALTWHEDILYPPDIEKRREEIRTAALTSEVWRFVYTMAETGPHHAERLDEEHDEECPACWARRLIDCTIS